MTQPGAEIGKDPHEGIQYNPYVGAGLPAVDVTIDDPSVRIYVNAVGDEGFWAFQASALARFGIKVAPFMILDRDLTARHVGGPGLNGFHARQKFTFNAPQLVGVTYRLNGEVTDVYNKRGIDYFITRSVASPHGGFDAPVIASEYTRAYRFPKNQFPRNAERPKQMLSEWLRESGADLDASFPAVGSVVEGCTNLYDQARTNLYSDQVAGMHTDDHVARVAGLEGTVVQALMATELELRLYRDLFGLAVYKRGQVQSTYIEPIRCGVSLRALCVVEESREEELKLKSAVATAQGVIVAVGGASVRYWLTEDDVDDEAR